MFIHIGTIVIPTLGVQWNSFWFIPTIPSLQPLNANRQWLHYFSLTFDFCSGRGRRRIRRCHCWHCHMLFSLVELLIRKRKKLLISSEQWTNDSSSFSWQFVCVNKNWDFLPVTLYVVISSLMEIHIHHQSPLRRSLPKCSLN